MREQEAGIRLQHSSYPAMLDDISNAVRTVANDARHHTRSTTRESTRPLERTLNASKIRIPKAYASYNIYVKIKPKKSPRPGIDPDAGMMKKPRPVSRYEGPLPLLGFLLHVIIVEQGQPRNLGLPSSLDHVLTGS